jgi:hypothetical protein
MNWSSKNHLWSEQGSVTIEFAVSSILFMFLAFATVEYGVLYSQRLGVTQLAREGASLASRNLTTNGNMMAMLQSTEGALGLNGHPEKYSLHLAQINGSVGLGLNPVCTVTSSGTLSHADISVPAPASNCDLPQNLYDYLEWDAALGAAAVNQFTVLTVYYEHTPLTPVGGMTPFLGGPGHQDTTLLLASRAIF